jgi:NTP pyrophosphatase (non-canonical NTP hydrolase)
MDAEEYQRLCRLTDLYGPDNIPEGVPEDGYKVWLLEYRALCASGELGELTDKMTVLVIDSLLRLVSHIGKLDNKSKKLRRDFNGILTQEMRDGLKHELGDIMWYLTTICTILGISLEDVMVKNITTLLDRKERDKIQGDGDNR